MNPKTDYITHYICKKKSKYFDGNVLEEELIEIAGQSTKEVLELLKKVEDNESS